MKKIILLLLIFTTTVVFSQDEIQKEDTPEQEAREMTAKMKSQLNLSAEQEERVYGLYLRKALNKDKKIDGKSRTATTMQKEAAKTDKESFKAEMRAVLTKEQYGRWIASKDRDKKEKFKNVNN